MNKHYRSRKTVCDDEIEMYLQKLEANVNEGEISKKQVIEANPTPAKIKKRKIRIIPKWI